MYFVGYAPDDHGTCSSPLCKDESVPILSGNLYLGVHVVFSDETSTDKFRHWGCVTPSILNHWRKVTQMDMDLVEGCYELAEEEQQKVKLALEQVHVDDEEWRGDEECNRYDRHNKNFGMFVRDRRTEGAIQTEQTFLQTRIQRFDLTDSIVTVQVGSSETMSFKVYRELLCSSSEFLKAKNEPEWRKGNATASLSDVAPEAFSIYVNRLYSHEILTGAGIGVGKKAASSEWQNLAASFVLGEAVIDSAFKDVMDTILAKVRNERGRTIIEAGPAMLTTIYAGTPVGSPARKFMVAVYRAYAQQEHVSEVVQGLPQEFLGELTLKSIGNRSTVSVEGIWWNNWDYHSHDLVDTSDESEQLSDVVRKVIYRWTVGSGERLVCLHGFYRFSGMVAADQKVY